MEEANSNNSINFLRLINRIINFIIVMILLKQNDLFMLVIALNICIIIDCIFLLWDKRKIGHWEWLMILADIIAISLNCVLKDKYLINFQVSNWMFPSIYWGYLILSIIYVIMEITGKIKTNEYAKDKSSKKMNKYKYAFFVGILVICILCLALFQTNPFIYNCLTILIGLVLDSVSSYEMAMQKEYYGDNKKIIRMTFKYLIFVLGMSAIIVLSTICTIDSSAIAGELHGCSGIANIFLTATSLLCVAISASIKKVDDINAKNI